MNCEHFLLDHEDYNETNRRWAVSALSIPNSELQRIEIDGHIINDQDYKLQNNFIDFNTEFILPEDSKVVAFISINLKKTRTQFNALITVAIIGLFGTIFQTVFPHIICIKDCSNKINEDLVSMNSTNFGLIDNNTRFTYKFGKLEIEDAGRFVKRKTLKEDQFWFALRVRDHKSLDDYTFENGAEGTYQFDNGKEIKFDVSAELISEANSKKENIQLIVIKAKKDIDLSKSFTLRNLKGNARAVQAVSAPLQ